MARCNLDRVAYWRGVLVEQVDSGLSIEAFCRARKITVSAFYRWKARLASLESSASRPLPSPKSKHKTSDRFVPVRVVSDTLVELTLTNGVQLKLPLAADVEQVARLVKAVAAC